MFVSELIPGDVLRRWKDGVWHLGIYWGNGQVLHNIPGPKGGEQLSTFAAFAAGKSVEAARPDEETRPVIMRRAHSILANPKPYSYLWRNCEHTVYEIVEGAPRSPTVRRLDEILGVAVVATVTALGLSFRHEIGRAARRVFKRGRHVF